MLLLLAVLFLAAAASPVGEVATYPARAQGSARSSAPPSTAACAVAERATEPPLPRARRSRRVAAARGDPAQAEPAPTVETIGVAPALPPGLVAAGHAARVPRDQGRRPVGGVLSDCCSRRVGSPASARLPAAASARSASSARTWSCRMRIAAARERVRGELPDALDLLAVSVEAGPRLRRRDHEADRAHGRPARRRVRAHALRDPHRRGRQVALKKHGRARRRDRAVERSSRAVIQADQLGISLGRILRVQATDSRLRRQAAAEEKAMKAPIKMLFPTVLFIFPAMFLVILGPALLNIMKVF